jgi:formate-dependent phosphoribosylglycinamide formyltransferase (GAR transformylase)
VDVTVGSNHRQVLADHAPGRTLTVGVKDVDRSTATIVRFASDYPLAAIVAAEDDFTPVAAAASEALGLTHHPRDAVRCARNKALMRSRLSVAGFSSPWFHVASLQDDPVGVASRTTFPCVLKPLSLSASRGVIRVDTADEFVRAWHRIRGILQASEVIDRSGGSPAEILIEAYLPGHEVAVEGIVAGGELLTLAILDKPDSMEGPFFEETILLTPSRFPDKVQDDIVSFVRRCAAHLGLDDGPIHAELRVDADHISLLEIAPRSIGGRCSAILRFDPDATLEELIVRHALGMPLQGFAREPMASGVMMLPIPRAGILREVAGVDAALEVAGIEGLELTIPLGQRVVPLPEGNRYLGFLFARADSPDQVETALRLAHARLDVQVEPS